MKVYKSKFDDDPRIIIASDVNAIVVGISYDGLAEVTGQGEIERLRTNSRILLVDGILYSNVEEIS